VLEPNDGTGVPPKLIGPLMPIRHPRRVDLIAVEGRLELDEYAQSFRVPDCQ
jgi:hypothetical protein